MADQAAIAFSAVFYDALAAGKSVAVACKAGQTVISINGDGDPGDMIQLRTRKGVHADTVFLTTQPGTRRGPSERRGGAH